MDPVIVLGVLLSLPFWLGSLLAVHALLAGNKFPRVLSLLTSATAWFLGMMFVCGGFSKLMPFPGVMGPVWLEESLAPYQLGTFARFIAWSEAVIGLLLLIRRTRILGAIAMVPLLANILMVTVSLNWSGTPWIIMGFLSANLYLLIYQYPIWRPIIANRVVFKWQRLGKQAVVDWLPVISLVMLLVGPFVYRLNGVAAAILMGSGLLCLITLEFLTRENPYNREKNRSEG